MAPDNPSAKLGRGPTFALITFVMAVTLFSVWFNWQATIVQNRFQVLRETGVEYWTTYRARPEFPDRAEFLPVLPPWRRWFNDEAIAAIGVPHDYPENRFHEVRRLFPEALTILKFSPTVRPVTNSDRADARPEQRESQK